MMQLAEWEALASRVRKHYGQGASVGGYNQPDIAKLVKLAAQIDVREAEEAAARPLSEAGTRLHRTRERAHKAWQTITESQAALKRERRLHDLNGAPAEFFENLDIPIWGGMGSTVEARDAANAEAAELATEWEERARKIAGYVRSDRRLERATDRPGAG
jgi:hypothetical protein